MSFILECIKIKRTGLAAAFFGSGILAAAVPVLNMAVRAENYLGLHAEPVQILMDANWQMMAMLNVLVIIAGACLMYHTEYADRAMQRMCTLPIRGSRLFFSKVILAVLLCVAMLSIEAAGTAFCLEHWFGASRAEGIELLKNFGYAWILMLPAVLGALAIASACKNMWVSLGIGVVCISIASMLPTGNFALSLFPFALPFQTLAGTAESTVRSYLIAAAVEIFGIGVWEVLFIKIRRLFE